MRVKIKEGSFDLLNADKVTRALDGSPTPNGSVGGVRKSDGSYDSNELLAEYDKLGGLIRKGTDKVKTGSFYDFKLKEARKEAKLVFLYRVNGHEVEVEDGTELPGVIKATRILEAEKGKKKEKVVDEVKEVEEEEVAGDEKEEDEAEEKVVEKKKPGRPAKK